VQLPMLTSVGGYLYIVNGINFDHSAITFGAGRVIAISEYALHIKDGKYRAGCRGPWSAAEALNHWGDGHETPSRANLFMEAIKQIESGRINHETNI